MKECIVCVRNENQQKLSPEDRRNNLTERDVQLSHCSECGECVCGFCKDLQVCH